MRLAVTAFTRPVAFWRLFRHVTASLVFVLTAFFPSVSEIHRPVHTGSSARSVRNGAALEITSLAHDAEFTAPPDHDDQGHTVTLAVAVSAGWLGPEPYFAGVKVALVSFPLVSNPPGPIQGRAPPVI